MKDNVEVGLHQVPIGYPMTVRSVVESSEAPEWAGWLREIGFYPGERVVLMNRGFLGGDPLMVRIGMSTFALRAAEAACVRVVATQPGLQP
jgi:ferrous iron transport protein A